MCSFEQILGLFHWLCKFAEGMQICAVHACRFISSYIYLYLYINPCLFQWSVSTPHFGKLKLCEKDFQDLQVSKSHPKKIGGRTPTSLGAGNSNIVVHVHPEGWGKIWKFDGCIFFTDGLVKNHQATKVWSTSSGCQLVRWCLFWRLLRWPCHAEKTTGSMIPG